MLPSRSAWIIVLGLGSASVPLSAQLSEVKLLSSSPTAGDYFGNSVAFAGDAAAVGAPFEAPEGSLRILGRNQGGAASSGFYLTATGVEGAKNGLPFFGTNGRQANPRGNGTSCQCVVPPVVRAPIMTGSGTNGPCDGSFALDLNPTRVVRGRPECAAGGASTGRLSAPLLRYSSSTESARAMA